MKSNNLLSYIKNEKLLAFISYYNYYKKFQNNLDKSNNATEKYYLIKDSVISEIKNICNFDQLNQVLVRELNMNIPESTNEKEIVKFIKNIPINILETYFSQNNRIKKISKERIEPENKYIINQNTSNYANIYENFGIIEKKVAESFIEGISPYSSTDKNVFDCTLINGRVIIEYGKSLENPNYVCVIGSVDPNNLLVINEYALIYRDYKNYYSHISTLKINLIISCKNHNYLMEFNQLLIIFIKK